MAGESVSDQLATDRLWIGRDGEVAPPKAPAGGGGTGGFRSNNFLGKDVELSPLLPHPENERPINAIEPRTRNFANRFLVDHLEQFLGCRVTICHLSFRRRPT